MRTGDGLGLPINGKVRDIKVRIGLPPIIVPNRTKQVHSIGVLTVQEIGRIDLACIHQVLIWQEFLLGQPIMDRREGTLIMDACTGGLHMSDELRRKITRRFR